MLLFNLVIMYSMLIKLVYNLNIQDTDLKIVVLNFIMVFPPQENIFYLPYFKQLILLCLCQ